MATPHVSLQGSFLVSYFLLAQAVCFSWLLFVVDPVHVQTKRIMPLSIAPLPLRMVFAVLLTVPIGKILGNVLEHHGVVATIRATLSLPFLWICWGASMFCLAVPVSLSSSGLGGFWLTSHGQDTIRVLVIAIAIGFPLGSAGLVYTTPTKPLVPIAAAPSQPAPQGPPGGAVWPPQNEPDVTKAKNA